MRISRRLFSTDVICLAKEHFEAVRNVRIPCQTDNNSIIVDIPQQDEKELSELLLDFSLRITIARETAEVKKLIINRALFLGDSD